MDIRRFDTSDIMSMILGHSNTTVSLGFLRPNGSFYDVIVILLLYMRPRDTFFLVILSVYTGAGAHTPSLLFLTRGMSDRLFVSVQAYLTTCT